MTGSVELLNEVQIIFSMDYRAMSDTYLRPLCDIRVLCVLVLNRAGAHQSVS